MRRTRARRHPISDLVLRLRPLTPGPAVQAEGIFGLEAGVKQGTGQRRRARADPALAGTGRLVRIGLRQRERRAGARDAESARDVPIVLLRIGVVDARRRESDLGGRERRREVAVISVEAV